MNQFEIEIKSLLGSKEKADQLVQKMHSSDPNFISLGSHKQLNHYFTQNANTITLYSAIVNYLLENKKEQLKKILDNPKNLSVRTRQADDKVLLVIKATIDDTTSSNGTARLELESEMNMSLEDLDKLVLSAGFEYQAKWSRERQEFKYKDLSVSIDKNAGYGYLAEFEKVIDDQTKADETKALIRETMKLLEVQELAQDRLERMFAHYNANWKDYYGTDKTFTID